MKSGFKLIGALALLGPSLAAVAEGFDGSRPMLCAVTETASCLVRGECVQGPADVVNLPLFFRVDVQAKRVESAREGGERRTSEILASQASEGVLVVQGAERGAAWGATINTRSGRMTLTASRDGEGYVVFGACILL